MSGYMRNSTVELTCHATLGEGHFVTVRKFIIMGSNSRVGHVMRIRCTWGSCGQTQNHQKWESKGDNPEGIFVNEGPGVSKMPDEHLKKQLYLLHAATGYCSTRNLVLALKKRGASSPVSKAAEEFQCTICAEKQKLNGKHAATLEPLPPKWAMLSPDGGHWTHNETKETVGFAVLIDEGSRFRTAKVLCRGKKQTLNASVYSVLKRELDAILWKTHNISVASCRCFPPKQS